MLARTRSRRRRRKQLHQQRGTTPSLGRTHAHHRQTDIHQSTLSRQQNDAAQLGSEPREGLADAQISVPSLAGAGRHLAPLVLFATQRWVHDSAGSARPVWWGVGGPQPAEWAALCVLNDPVSMRVGPHRKYLLKSWRA